MNSYQNKKRKRNLVKKAKKKTLLIERISSSWVVPIEWKSVFDILFEETMLGGDIPKAIDNLPVEILKRRYSGKSWGYRLK
jgi:hypothetical protein